MFTGSMVALITPFNNERGVDREALGNIVSRCVDAGIEALVPCGTTGESAVLSDSEYVEVLATVLHRSQGRVPVIAGCGTNSTEKTVARGLLAKKAGVDGVLVVTPYYNRPNQESLVHHFTEVATRVELPVILYNVPSRTGVDLLPPAVLQLSEHPLIVGIKEATGSLKRACELAYSVPKDFALLSGDDFTALSFLLSGGNGAISVVANVTPHHLSDLVRHCREGHIQQAIELNKLLYPLMNALFCDTNPVPVKMAMKLLGFGDGNPRSPLLALNAHLTSDMQKILHTMNLG